MTLAAVIPMAFVMIAGPQIITAVLLATSEKWLRNSACFLAAVALATSIGVSLTYFAARGTETIAESGGASGPSVIDWFVVALLVFLAFRVFQRRTNTAPPKWMAKLQSATPGDSFKVGFLLFMLMPTDIITMATVGASLARNNQPLWYALVFLFATLLLAGAPLLIDVLLGKKAKTILPKLRDWMSVNSWIVSEVVIVFFLAMTIKGIITG
jgi:threonine/homoserine/homoserine lactone efflux protein